MYILFDAPPFSPSDPPLPVSISLSCSSSRSSSLPHPLAPSLSHTQQIRSAAAACVQFSVLMAVAGNQPTKALVGLRAALSRLADTAPVALQTPPPSQQVFPYFKNLKSVLTFQLTSKIVRGLTCVNAQQQQQQQHKETVSSKYLEILGHISHILLLYPVRLLASKLSLEFVGEVFILKR